MDFNALFKGFNSKRVLIVGDAMIDAYMWGDINRISPEAPVPVVEVHTHENRLGGAANVALNLKSLLPIIKNFFLLLRASFCSVMIAFLKLANPFFGSGG